MEESCKENVNVDTVASQHFMFSQPPPPPPPPPRVPSTSSPAKRSATHNSSGAVIRSPMTMTTSYTYGLDGFASGNSMPRNVEDASPLSTTTAAEYAEIEQKQLELRGVVEHRIVTLERLLQRREEELEELRLQLRKTEEDYQFNYDLIKDRDAALEEAATQLQSLYDELKRYKSDEVTTGKRLEVLEQETHQLRQRLRETEVQREQIVQRTQQTYDQKEKQLKEVFIEKEKALEYEKQRLHEEYLRRFKNLDDARAELSEKNGVLEVQLEKKWKQEIARLEQKISESMDAMDALQRDKSALETRCAESSQSLSLLKLEYEALERRHEALVTESTEKQRNCAETSQSLSLLKLEYEALERRHEALVTESTEKQRNCAETSQSLSLLKLEYEALERRHEALVTESMEKQRQYELRLSECNAIMGQSVAAAEDGIRQQTLRVKALEAECVHLRRREAELEWSLRLQRLRREEEAERAADVAAEAVERARFVGAVRVAERRAAEDGALRQQRRWREEAAEARRAAEDARDEAARRTRELHETSERAQTEAARLTRELHASEAARRALEEHFHLAVEPGNGAAPALIESLRREKEALERKSLELERTNAAIKEQVASFTMELQNDPAIKLAKETQRRVSVLQEELLQARDENQQLRDKLRNKEEEVSRYQLEILRARSTETAAAHHRDEEDRRLREEVKNAKESYERMRQALKDQQQQQQQQQQQHQQQQRRHHRRDGKSGGKLVRRQVSRNRSNSSSSSSDDIGSSSSCTGGRDTKDNNKRGHEKVVPSTTQKETELLREAELWRRKYLQLEQNIRDLLRERDGLTKELNLTRQDVEALTSEKQSLLDLNSLLKAQLREAYRTALEYPPPPPPPLPLPPQQEQQREKVSTSHQTGLGLLSNRATTRESSQSVPHLAVDDIYNSTTALKSSAEAERLSALEEELAAMKAFMVTQRQGAMRASHSLGGTTVTAKEKATTRKSQRSQQQQDQIPSTQSRRPIVQSRTPVVRRGSSAVRHYGYM
ncbi:hypothetical protein LSM04_007844 [Trypanosoma melophagium]|uniref:uncharacterized protein n=1 Tax=Trypanosoma melophagium TaxID=715481 RepID=UPI00351AA2B7|nr:hypothetical protein LSM04_007844 [Trypanosoma melophagium]